MSQYFENDNNVKSKSKKIEYIIKQEKYEIYTDNGVFSKKGLDFGTRTLLESLPVMSGDVLDFGCGYGPIGIFIRKNYECNVDMVDVNLRSLKLAKKNALLNKVEVNIFQSDIYSNITEKYDYIVSNPPIRVGKETEYKILFEAKEHLKKNGELWIVVNKNQGAKSLCKDLEKSYKVSLVVKNKGFYIIMAKNID